MNEKLFNFKIYGGFESLFLRGRKTFGTIALNQGYSIESVSRMLGHTDIKTTQKHYAVIFKKRIIEEV